MRAAQIDEYGGKDVVHVTDAPKPTLESGQVLVEAKAAGVNPFDIKVRSGATQQMTKLTFPATLGGDVSGVVSEVGPDVTGFAVGQSVYGQAGALSGHGSFAQFVPVKISQLADKPASVDFVTAAALPLVASSADQALNEHMHLQPGQKILIHGGGGGIGSVAIQLAKHLGAYVATTAGPDDLEFVKNLGADEVIDYRSQDFSTMLHDYDEVYDMVGGEANTKSYGILKPGGVIVSMVAAANEELVGQHQVHYVHQFSKVTTERLQRIAKLVDEGVLKAHVDRVFPLTEVADALEYLATGHPRGKVVLKIAD